MNKTPSPIPYASRRDWPRSGALMAAAVLCFLGTLAPLYWLAIQAVNIQSNQLLAAFTGARLPFGLLLLEDAACALSLSALLIVVGVLLCIRARWAIHLTGAVMGVVLVGMTGETLAEAVRRFSNPFGRPMSNHIVEITIRAGIGIVWPLVVVMLLSHRSVREAIVSRRGSIPAAPILIFVAGAVLIWMGLAATSLHAQASPMDAYFARFYRDTAVTLWRVAFATVWVLAGVLLLRASMTGWMLALVVTLAAIMSEMLLAGAGGSVALIRRTFAQTSDQLNATLATAGGPHGPWLASLYRSATPLCLLILLFLAAPHFLFEEVPDAPEPENGKEQG